ncbi:ABC transporter permease, partial [Mycobacterium tuberculosis]|nr:ABC transporter permease [Mycobacterium tuberculosis]
MLRPFLRRLAEMVVVMALVVTIVFVIVRIAPGDPAAMMLGPDATPQDVVDLRARLGLDQPLPVQYVAWLAAVVAGDFGYSIQRGGEAVLPLVLSRIGPT